MMQIDSSAITQGQFQKRAIAFLCWSSQLQRQDLKFLHLISNLYDRVLCHFLFSYVSTPSYLNTFYDSFRVHMASEEAQFDFI